jgi:hypothetical protein
VFLLDGETRELRDFFKIGLQRAGIRRECVEPSHVADSITDVLGYALCLVRFFNFVTAWS